ncbi:MAG: class I SAM-dependent methyltransferase [Chthoniobacterales bacterium]|nr:class I SAM-dependent methyltransferase [Chthoniobacterales bacterium]
MDVLAFFSHWETYRLCIERNTLHHREVGEILRGELLAVTKPFTFLDLACGDAQLTSRLLAGTRVEAYTGVDFSAPALALARNNMAALDCVSSFRETDFTGFLRTGHHGHDIIYLGLSLHHFEHHTKGDVMKHLYRATNPGGSLYLFEPVLRGGETREDYLARWHQSMDTDYANFSEVQREQLWRHVSTSDFPERPEEYGAMARAGGFRDASVLFTAPKGFYSLFRFSA